MNLFLSISSKRVSDPVTMSNDVVMGALGRGKYNANDPAGQTSCWRSAAKFLSRVKHRAENYQLIILTLQGIPAHAIVIDDRRRVQCDIYAKYFVSGNVDNGFIEYKLPITEKGNLVDGKVLSYRVASNVNLASCIRRFEQENEK